MRLDRHTRNGGATHSDLLMVHVRIAFHRTAQFRSEPLDDPQPMSLGTRPPRPARDRRPWPSFRTQVYLYVSCLKGANHDLSTDAHAGPAAS